MQRLDNLIAITSNILYYNYFIAPVVILTVVLVIPVAMVGVCQAASRANP